MATFNSGKNIAVVLQLQNDDEKEVLSLLKENTSKIFGLSAYAYILHDKDVLENGGIKGKHVHMAIKGDVARSSNNWIAHFADNLKLDKDAVSVEMLGSEKAVLRYLLHLDDPTKHQYDRSEVITNNVEMCRRAWNTSNSFNTSPTLEQLIEANKEGARGVYNLVGLSYFERAYRVLEKVSREDDKVKLLENEITALYEEILTFSANPKYLKTGLIPMKDFQKVMDEVAHTYTKMREIAKIEKEFEQLKRDGKIK